MTLHASDDLLFGEDRFQPGLGTYSLTGERGTETIAKALEAGYRHVDTARLYGNESEVGEALRMADVDTDDVLVATKVAHFEEPEKTPDYVRTAITESRERLGVDTIDLLYHHWPLEGSEIETVLSVFAEFVRDGVVDNVAVSNYPVRFLERIESTVDVPIVADQVEMHPLLQQEELYDYLRERGIYLVAYSPLAQGKVFDVDELVEIADKHGTTPTSVSLAWLLQKEGVVPIPRSSSIEHVEQNYAARELALDDEDVEKIESIDRQVRLEDPDGMEW